MKIKINSSSALSYVLVSDFCFYCNWQEYISEIRGHFSLFAYMESIQSDKVNSIIFFVCHHCRIGITVSVSIPPSEYMEALVTYCEKYTFIYSALKKPGENKVFSLLFFFLFVLIFYKMKLVCVYIKANMIRNEKE